MAQAEVPERSPDQQRSWQERWGVDGLELRHWLFIIGLGNFLISPFLALARPEAGGIALMVGAIFTWLWLAGGEAQKQD